MTREMMGTQSRVLHGLQGRALAFCEVVYAMLETGFPITDIPVLDEMLGCIRQRESVLQRFKELKGLMREDPAGELIGSLIEKAELEVAQAMRRLIQ